MTTDVVPAQFVVSVDDIEKKVNLYRRHREAAHRPEFVNRSRHVKPK